MRFASTRGAGASLARLRASCFAPPGKESSGSAPFLCELLRDTRNVL